MLSIMNTDCNTWYLFTRDTRESHVSKFGMTHCLIVRIAACAIAANLSSGQGSSKRSIIKSALPSARMKTHI